MPLSSRFAIGSASSCLRIGFLTLVELSGRQPEAGREGQFLLRGAIARDPCASRRWSCAAHCRSEANEPARLSRFRQRDSLAAYECSRGRPRRRAQFELLKHFAADIAAACERCWICLSRVVSGKDCGDKRTIALADLQDNGQRPFFGGNRVKALMDEPISLQPGSSGRQDDRLETLLDDQRQNATRYSGWRRSSADW